jgi:CPA1 family monovalent cation:H+ antiporter
VRVPSYAVWETAVFVLNVLAFVLIGLQIGPIFEGLAAGQRLTYPLIGAAVLATVILIRFAWVMSYYGVARWHIQRVGFHPPRPMTAPTVKGALLVSWCGMRGLVTMAAALALPGGEGGPAFPFRDLIVFVAFFVVLGTLLLQGLTLRPLLLRLDLRDDDPVGEEVRRARARAYEAALGALDGDESELAEALRIELRAALLDVRGGRAVDDVERGDSLRLKAVAASRRAILAMRSSREIGDAAFHRLEEELDRIELSAS